ncbi:radical SAM superfamily protein [Nitzschia inconspicua]|uniref:Radical SAM superfamily protein n=1 Tax=Nitzschia inconspicua TaxID=303405 RepID=A0A9K3PHW3_9STRA|nr:radical SAM superfamily protein [Nitzschia inconspicua]
MKFATYALLSVLAGSELSGTSWAFAPWTALASTKPLHSTLAPEAPSWVADEDDGGNSRINHQTRTSPSVSSRLKIEVQRDVPNVDDESFSSSGGALAMSIEELSEKLGGRGRAQIVWDCYSIGVDPANLFGRVIKLGWDDYETILNELPSQRRSQRLGPETLEKLKELYQQSFGEKVKKVEGGVATLSHISRAKDDTTKLLLKLSDGMEVETVIIPWKGKRSTLCISSQVGCRQGCTFCATGKMGKLRDLSTSEILAQMFYALKIQRLEELPEISNVVFMGMGEPSDNVENVVRATKILTTRELFQMSASKVTVSTVAPTPEAFKEFAKAPCVLAWSVHAVNDDLRKKLVPTTKYSMEELRQGLIDGLLSRPINARTCMLEVALMRGVNDQLEHAKELAEFTQVLIDRIPGVKPHINLIPYNDIGQHSLYEKPLAEDVVAFQKHLQSKGMYAHIRSTRGDDKIAACGQLATSKRPNMIS